MKTINLIISICVLMTAFSACQQHEEKKVKSLEIFTSLQSNLQQELGAAIKKGGPILAMETCKIKSPEIEKSRSNENLEIKRISLKPRNPDHQPNSIESTIIQDWENNYKTKMPETVVRQSDGIVYVLEPIFIQKEVCLNCHGNPDAMAPELLSKIKELYPNDQATGYQIGDLRGAFSARWSNDGT